MKTYWKYYLVALVIILIDQALKLYVHFNLPMGAAGQVKLIGNFFKIYYTLNPGMAFGIHFGYKYGKLLLTLIRIITSGFIFVYIGQLAQAAKPMVTWLWGWALILGGAIGNGIDSTLYAVLLGNAPPDAPMQWFYGQVIDMLYLNLWSGTLPSWLPWIGGSFFCFLPIFNIADVAIFFGVLLIFLVKNKKTEVVCSPTADPVSF